MSCGSNLLQLFCPKIVFNETAAVYCPLRKAHRSLDICCETSAKTLQGIGIKNTSTIHCNETGIVVYKITRTYTAKEVYCITIKPAIQCHDMI